MSAYNVRHGFTDKHNIITGNEEAVNQGLPEIKVNKPDKNKESIIQSLLT